MTDYSASEPLTQQENSNRQLIPFELAILRALDEVKSSLAGQVRERAELNASADAVRLALMSLMRRGYVKVQKNGKPPLWLRTKRGSNSIGAH